MVTFLFIVMMVSLFVFILTISLMTPKGGLGFGIGGVSTSNEYGSKKSLENTLKKSAVLSIIVFTICAIVYPYANKKNLVVKTPVSNSKSTTTTNKQEKNGNIKVNVKDNTKINVKTTNTVSTGN